MSKATVKLYKATWCGHCNDFLPEWEKLCDVSKEAGIETVKYDADADKEVVEKANIKGFPSIMLSVNGVDQEYNGKRNADDILTAIKNLKSSGSRPTLRGGGLSVRGGGISVPSEPVVSLYKSDRCGHCIAFKDEWTKFCGQAAKNKITTVTYDAATDAVAVAKAGISGYPTIMLSVNGTTTEYDGPRKAAAILAAVEKLQSGGRQSLSGGGNGVSSSDYQKYRKYKGKYLHLRSRLDRAGVSL
jgi:protein disulfide-isomerase A4